MFRHSAEVCARARVYCLSARPVVGALCVADTGLLKRPRLLSPQLEARLLTGVCTRDSAYLPLPFAVALVDAGRPRWRRTAFEWCGRETPHTEKETLNHATDPVLRAYA
jgi:hypothetical protein